MEKRYLTEISHAIIKKHPSAAGLMKVLQWSDDKTERGELMLFIEIDVSDHDNEKIIKILSTELSKHYFTVPTESAEFAFEHSLARANISIKDTLLSKPKSWLSKIHVIVAAVCNQEIHVSCVGNMHAFLTHKDKIVDIVGRSSEQETRSGNISALPNPVKLFSQVVSGRIVSGDSISFMNEAVLDYLSLERIRKTAEENSALGTINTLKQLLLSAPDTKQFGLVAIKRAPIKINKPSIYEAPREKEIIIESKSAAQAQEKKQAQEKITQKSTIIEQYLRPQETNKFTKGQDKFQLKQIGNFLRKIGGQAGTKAHQLSAEYGNIALNACLTGLSKGLSVLRKNIIKLPGLGASFAIFIKTICTSAAGRRYYFQKIRESWISISAGAKIFAKNLPINCKNKWLSLTKKQQIAIAGILILGIILIISISLRSRTVANNNYKADYENLITAIKQKNDQTEAALIYKDEILARQIIQEATVLLDKLPQKTAEEISAYQELKEKNLSFSNKIDKREVLTQLAPFTDISFWPSETDLIFLFTVDKKIFYLDARNKKLAELNLNDKLLIPVPFLQDTDSNKFVKALNFDENKLIVLGEKSVIFNTSNESIKQKSFTIDKTTVAYTSYFNNIYALVPNAGKILRYRDTGANFSAGENWLKEPYDLSNTTDIAVDGSIWLLRANGDIQVYDNGRFTRSMPLLLNDALGKGAKLFLNADLPNIYILDPEKQRIIKLNKVGQLQTQYIAAELAQARAFTITKDEKNIFFASNGKIYQIPIQ